MPYLNKEPFKPWIVNFITSDQVKAEPHVVQVLKRVRHDVLPDETVKQIHDGVVYINSVFSRDALEDFRTQCEDDDDDLPSWDRSTIILQRYSLRHLVLPQADKCEFVLCVDKFSLWTIDGGFRPKLAPAECMAIRAVHVKSRTLWNQAKSAADTDYSMSSVPLSQLLAHLDTQMTDTEHSQQASQLPSASSQHPAVSTLDVSVQQIHSVVVEEEGSGDDVSSINSAEPRFCRRLIINLDEEDTASRPKSGSSSQEEFFTPSSSPQVRPGPSVTPRTTTNVSQSAADNRTSGPRWMTPEQFFISAMDQHVLDFLPEWTLSSHRPSAAAGKSLSTQPVRRPAPQPPHSAPEIVHSGTEGTTAQKSTAADRDPPQTRSDPPSPGQRSSQKPLETQPFSPLSDSVLEKMLDASQLSRSAADLSRSRRSSTDFPWLATSTLEADRPARGTTRSEGQTEDDLPLSMDEEEEVVRLSSTPASVRCMTGDKGTDNLKLSMESQLENSCSASVCSTHNKSRKSHSSQRRKSGRKNKSTRRKESLECSPVLVASGENPKDMLSKDIHKSPGVIELSSSDVIVVKSSGETNSSSDVVICSTQKDSEKVSKDKPNTVKDKSSDVSRTLYSSPEELSPHKYDRWTCQTPGSEEEQAPRSSSATQTVDSFGNSLDKIAQRFQVVDRPANDSLDGQIVDSTQTSSADKFMEDDSVSMVHVQSTQHPTFTSNRLPELPLSPVRSEETQNVPPSQMEVEVDVVEEDRLQTLARISRIEASDLGEKQRLEEMCEVGQEQEPELFDDANTQSQSLLPATGGQISKPNKSDAMQSQTTQQEVAEIPDSTTENVPKSKRTKLSKSKTVKKNPTPLKTLYPSCGSAKKKYDVSVLYGSSKKNSCDEVTYDERAKGKRKLFNMGAILEAVQQDMPSNCSEEQAETQKENAPSKELARSSNSVKDTVQPERSIDDTSLPTAAQRDQDSTNQVEPTPTSNSTCSLMSSENRGVFRKIKSIIRVDSKSSNSKSTRRVPLIKRWSRLTGESLEPPRGTKKLPSPGIKFSLHSITTPFNSLPGNQEARSTDPVALRGPERDAAGRQGRDDSGEDGSFQQLFSNQPSGLPQLQSFLRGEGLAGQTCFLNNVHLDQDTQEFVSKYFKT